MGHRAVRAALGAAAMMLLVIGAACEEGDSPVPTEEPAANPDPFTDPQPGTGVPGGARLRADVGQ